MSLFDEAANIISARPELAREIVRQFLRKRRDDPHRRVGLTSRQLDAPTFIEAYAEEHGKITPTFEEIAVAMDLRSRSGVYRLLEGLEERGYIVRMPRRARSIQLVEVA